MGIVNDDNNFLELDNSNKQGPNNLEDGIRINSEIAADVEENNNESEGQNLLKSEHKIVLVKPANCRQVRANIYSQISILSVNRYEYFKYNTCL